MRTCLLFLLACTGGAPSEAPPTPEAPSPAAPAAEPDAPPPAPPEGDWPADCPQPSDSVRYQHDTWAEREVCTRIRYSCEDGWDFFGSAECGCGCRKLGVQPE